MFPSYADRGRPRLDLDRAPVRRRFVCLDISSLAAYIILQLATNCIECVANSDIGVFVRLMLRRVAVCHQFVVRNPQVDTHMKWVAFVCMTMTLLDDYPATHDPIVEPFEFIDARPYIGLYRRGRFHVAKGDLYGYLHRRYASPRSSALL